MLDNLIIGLHASLLFVKIRPPIMYMQLFTIEAIDIKEIVHFIFAVLSLQPY
jgi:hypothetical protein